MKNISINTVFLSKLYNKKVETRKGIKNTRSRKQKGSEREINRIIILGISKPILSDVSIYTEK